MLARPFTRLQQAMLTGISNGEKARPRRILRLLEEACFACVPHREQRRFIPVSRLQQRGAAGFLGLQQRCFSRVSCAEQLGFSRVPRAQKQARFVGRLRLQQQRRV